MGVAKQARDEEFRGFVIGRRPRLLRTAFLLTGERHAAEDLVRTTPEKVYGAWRRGGPADGPDAYVRHVMINAHAPKTPQGTQGVPRAEGRLGPDAGPSRRR